jgi:hypothetical protein
MSEMRAALLVPMLMLFGATPVRAAQASPDGLWRPAAEIVGRPESSVVTMGYTMDEEVTWAQREYEVDAGRLEELLGPGRDKGPARITLPTGGGEFSAFELEPVATSPADAEPESAVRAWRGIGLDNPAYTVALTRAGPQILAVLRRGAERRALVPIFEGLHVLGETGGARTWSCELGPSTDAPAGAENGRSRGGEEYVLRLAIACTGEYARERGGTRGAVEQAIHLTVTRLNEIYGPERIRFVLVDRFQDLIFLDPAGDPFTNGNSRRLIEESQAVIGKRFAEEEYDIGHTFSTGAGGLAQAGAGVPGRKAKGVTGTSHPFADPFDVDYVAHEIAHQLGANHTFQGIGGSCSGNYAPAASYEPGSGSTILGYAGICKTDNLQPNSDDYFHAGSLREIRAHLARYAGSLPGSARVPNAPPVVDAGPDFAIPRGTPFRLLARNFDDPDRDRLTFCWEGLDRGSRPAAIGSADPSVDPLFRSFLPTDDPERTLPRMPALLGRDLAPGESLPSVARQLNFRVTARDRRGGVAWDDCVVSAVGDAGPFRVDFPQGPVRAGLVTLHWDPAHTGEAPISCERVRLLLSYDDGASFHILRESVPNSGSAEINLALFGERIQRIMVESEDRRFFALSDPFQVLPSDASIAFVPIGMGEAGKTISNARRALSPSGWQHLIVLAADGARHFALDLPEGEQLERDALLALLREDNPENRTRTILVIGPAQAVFELLGEIRGRATPMLDRAVLTLSSDGQLYQGFRRTAEGFETAVVERAGEWERDEEIYRTLEELELKMHVEHLGYSGD